jgi:hypothetical protein
VVADRGREAAEERELRSERPADPLVERAARDVDLLAVEDAGERLLEQ